VSESIPVRITGRLPARTVALPPRVTAAQCLLQPRRPQQGWGLTEIPGTTMGRPFTRTDATPEVFTPPAVLGSPCLCALGMSSKNQFFLWHSDSSSGFDVFVAHSIFGASYQDHVVNI